MITQANVNSANSVIPKNSEDKARNRSKTVELSKAHTRTMTLINTQGFVHARCKNLSH